MSVVPGERLCEMLKAKAIQPVLLDIGAAVAPPRVWGPIAPASIYVGFDPDRRELHEDAGARFLRSVIVNAAVTEKPGVDKVRFFLTRWPQSSSTLQPNTAALAEYLFADGFTVERETTAHAQRLEGVLAQLSLPGVDWLKTDSQGTDLRLFNSLPPPVRSRVLAADLEPGLIDAYVGEDLFVDVHRDLAAQGFWLSNFDAHGTVRMRQGSLRAATAADPRLTREIIEWAVRPSPCWCEVRYLRTLDWMKRGDFGEREYTLLWVFAVMDEQYGFALDVAMACEARFGADAALALKEEAVSLLRRAYDEARHGPPTLPVRLLSRLWRKLFR